MTRACPWDRTYLQPFGPACHKGGGSSSTSSESNTTTQQYDQRTAADGEALAVGAGANVTVNYSDPESVQDLIDVFGSLGESVLEGSGKAIDRALGLVEGNTAYLVDFVEKRTQTEETTLAQGALKLALPVVVAGLAIWGLKK